MSVACLLMSCLCWRLSFCQYHYRYRCVSAAYNNTVVHVHWLTGDDVMSSIAVFTLNESQFVDVNSPMITTRAISCMYANSSNVVLVSQMTRLSAAGQFTTLVPALATISSNYTFVAYRPQYSDDRQFEHYVRVVVERTSMKNVVLDGSRLNRTTTYWASLYGTHGRLVTATLRVQPGTHRLYTVDGQPLSGYMYGHSNHSAYGCLLASVIDGSGLWTRDYLWREVTTMVTSAITTSITSSSSSSSSTGHLSPSPIHTTPVSTVYVTTDDYYTITSSDADVTLPSTATNHVNTSETLLNHTSVAMRADNNTSARQSERTSATTTKCCASSAVLSDMSQSVTMSTDVRQTAALNYSSSLTSGDGNVTGMRSYEQQGADDKSAVSSLTSGDGNVTGMRSYEQQGADDKSSVNNETMTSFSTRDKQLLLSSTDATISASTSSTVVVTSSSNSSSSSSSIVAERDSTAAATSTIHQPEHLPQTYDNDDDDSAQVFELFKVVCIYGGLSVFCALLAAWFIYSQTTLLKRRVHAAANEHATSMSRDQTPVTETESECSVVLNESTSDSVTESSLSQSLDHNHWATRIVPLTPAYFTTPAISMSLDALHDGAKCKVHDVARSVDVDLLRQLASCRHNADCQKTACSDSTVAADARHRLYVETPQRQNSEQKLQHLISLPQSFSMTPQQKP